MVIALKKTVSGALFGAFLILLALGLAMYPKESAGAASEAIALCVNVIVPSPFPFFVVSSMTVKLCSPGSGYLPKGLSVPPGKAAFLLGLMGGYPVGARTVAACYLRGDIQKDEAERLLAFCNNSGPAFILGAAGPEVFGSTKAGLLLLVVHALCAALLGLLFGKKARQKAAAVNGEAEGLISGLVSSVSSSFSGVISVSGFIIFFSVIVRLLKVTGIFPAAAAVLGKTGLGVFWSEKLLTGFLELFSGVWTLTGPPSIPSLSLAAFMLGWGGLSVHFQTLSLLSGTGLSPRRYFLGKLLHGCLSAFLTALICLAFPAAVPAVSMPGAGASPAAVTLPLFALSACFLTLSVLSVKSSGKGDKKSI